MVRHAPSTVPVIVQDMRGGFANAGFLTHGARVLTMEQPLLPQVSKSMDYPVYPEDDGYDRPKNPYSPV